MRLVVKGSLDAGRLATDRSYSLGPVNRHIYIVQRYIIRLHLI